MEDMTKQTTTTNSCTKFWSENTNKWRYLPKDPDYFKKNITNMRGPKLVRHAGQ